VKYLVIGYDHHFGKDRGGNIKVLQQFEKDYGYEVEEIDALDIDHISISSSKIRHALEEGKITLANNYLGHYFFLYATVIPGKQLGRKLGYPTANLKSGSSDKLIPKIGVYFVEVVVDGLSYYGMMNIGYNPTTDSDQKVKMEVHIFDFSRDIYKETVRINFIDYIRDEKKFNNLEELTLALDSDKHRCMELIDEINKTLCAIKTK
jgi:riboflavin kinase/FMN adenylyltransferase